MAKLDHVSVVNEPQRTGNSCYKVKAALIEAPTATWQMRFQSAWLCRPECRQMCSNITFENNDICIAINDSCFVADSVSAIKNVMADVERQAHVGHVGFSTSRYSRKI